MVTNAFVVICRCIVGMTVSSTLFVRSAPAIIVHIFDINFLSYCMLLDYLLTFVMVTGSSLIWREGLSWSEASHSQFWSSVYDKALVEASEREKNPNIHWCTGEFCSVCVLVCVCVCVSVCVCVWCLLCLPLSQPGGFACTGYQHLNSAQASQWFTRLAWPLRDFTVSTVTKYNKRRCKQHTLLSKHILV